MADSPIAPIVEKFEVAVSLLLQQEGEVTGPIPQFIEYYEAVLQRLPRSYGQRFYFDALLLREFARDWNPALQLDRNMLPTYDSNWGYQALSLPSEDAISAYVLDVFLINGQERLADVNLLDYPWLFHELAHRLMFKYPAEFPSQFRPRLEAYLRRLRLARLADRASARKRADEEIRTLERFWSPQENQRNWAHEIAFDLCALWTCGHSFVDAYCSTVEEREPDPLFISQVHPPYVGRSNALIYGAKRLRLDASVPKLIRTRDAQLETVRGRSELSIFSAHFPEELANSAVDSAIAAAQALKLKRFVEREYREADGGFSCELLPYAHQMWQKNPSGFHTWQRGIVEKLAGEAMS